MDNSIAEQWANPQATKSVALDWAGESPEQQAISSGADPTDVARAKLALGKQDFNGWCQTFVERATGSGWQGASASDAWNNAKNKVSGLQGVLPGNPVYFNNPTDPNGHTGIYEGNNKFISATDNGVQENDINDWQNRTGQTALGYLPGIQ